MIRFAIIAALYLLPATAHSQAADRAFFAKQTLTPDADERRALDILAKSRPRGGPSGKPVMSADNSIRFVFGASLPVIICAPMQICDIELEAGEKIRSVQVGDAARWSVEPAVAGIAPMEIQHVIVKPADVSLRTSLVVTTDRRTYRMKLSSDAKRYMSSVSFSYPASAQAKWAQLAQARPPGQATGVSASRRRPTRRNRGANSPRAAGSLGAMSFDYELEGDNPPWKPTRVYNDGLQTVIEMPYAMRQTEAPTLLVVRAEGGLFTDDDVVQVNFHTQGTKYLVDMVFDVADLIVGVGTTQQKVRIRRK